MHRFALLLVLGCSHPVQKPTLPVVAHRHVVPPPEPTPVWLVPVRVMTWTSDGPTQIGELPGKPPLKYPQAWFVEPKEPLDREKAEKLVALLRSEHVPGLSLRGQRTAQFLSLLRDLPELTALVLDDSDVDGDSLAQVRLALRRIYLAHTTIDDRGVEALVAAQPALEVVDLSDCNVGDATARALAKLPELLAIDLSGTRITDEGGGALGALKKLSSVGLGRTKVGPRTVAALRELPLTEVFLEGTRVGPEVARLASLAPILERIDLSTLAAHKPTDAELEWLATAPRLVEASLNGAVIHDKLVKQIASLQALRELRVAAAPITLDAIAAIAARHDLEEVDLAETPIDDANAAALLTAPHMRVLRLDKTTIGDAALRGVPARSLRELYLSRTKVTDRGLEILHAVPDLEGLGLGDTGIGDRTIERIAKLVQLRTLVLSRAKAGYHVYEQLASLVHLERLYLEDTHAGDAAIAALEKATDLRALHLHGSNISDESLATLRRFTALEELTVGDTGVHASVADLSSWPHLRSFSAVGIPIDDAGVIAIAKAKTLTLVDLSATDVTDPSPLVALPNLKSLGLVQLRLSPAGEAALKTFKARGVELFQ